jgi:hypothetical protein
MDISGSSISNKTLNPSEKSIKPVNEKENEAINKIDDKMNPDLNDSKNANDVKNSSKLNKSDGIIQKDSILLKNVELASISKNDSDSKKKSRKLNGGTNDPCDASEIYNITNHPNARINRRPNNVFLYFVDDLVVKEFRADDPDFVNEINTALLLKDCNHVITSSKACFYQTNSHPKKYYYLFMENCQHELDDWYKSNVANGDVNAVKNVILEIARGIKEINDKRVIHLDIHSGNIMMCGGTLKFLDFGGSQSFGQSNDNIDKKKFFKCLVSQFSSLYLMFSRLLDEKNITDETLVNAVEKLNPEKQGHVKTIQEFITLLDGRKFIIL